MTRTCFKATFAPLRLCVLLLFLLSACNYRFGSGSLSETYRTINVPYVEGDATGVFTAALIKEIGVSSPFQFVNWDADLCLTVRLIGLREENVGFRYDLESNGTLADWIIPAETRLSAAAEITLVDNQTGTSLFGPICLSTAVDFDHDYYLSPNGINVFSLGQLSDIREGKEAATPPLSQALAQKIVAYIRSVW